MIAKIEPAFSSISTLSRKIDYQLEKISSGEAKELFNSTGDSLSSFSDYMFLFSSLNDRVKLPYSEITLNLSPGERLSEANWINLSKEYMEKMGYGNCCYSIILNKDKEHSHVHILHSRIDSEGKSVSNSLDYKRSEKLARELEKKYNLVSLKENERTKERLSSISGQRYYFDNALKKALRNYAVKERVMHILSSSGAAELLGDRLQKSKLSNEEWMSVLGNHEYDSILSILKKGGFLKSLYKDDLLSRLDKAFASSTTFQEFRANLQKEGVYMRLTSKKDKSYYVYGLSEDSFYIKDTSFPQKFRYGYMNFDAKSMSYTVIPCGSAGAGGGGDVGDKPGGHGTVIVQNLVVVIAGCQCEGERRKCKKSCLHYICHFISYKSAFTSSPFTSSQPVIPAPSTSMPSGVSTSVPPRVSDSPFPVLKAARASVRSLFSVVGVGLPSA